MVELFASKGVLYCLLITATSGTAAAKINGVTIYLACNLLKNTSRVGSGKNMDGFNSFRSISLHVDGQTKMD